jgi:hypothetical protein
VCDVACYYCCLSDRRQEHCLPRLLNPFNKIGALCNFSLLSELFLFSSNSKKIERQGQAGSGEQMAAEALGRILDSWNAPGRKLGRARLMPFIDASSESQGPDGMANM